MAVNVKMGVDLGGFKSGIQEGQNILKGLNAEMKATEAEFKATGNAEQAMEKRVKTLNSQLQVQKGIADQAQQALKAMEAAGIKPTDAAYQKMYATMMNATAGMNEAQAALNGLGQSANQAATNADSLNNSVNSIGKKLSIDQVLSGINSITSGLENAAKKAVQLGEDIWNAMMQSAQLADDIGTQATIMDMTPERYQQYKGVFDTIGEITVSEWAATKRKVQQAINKPTQDQVDVLKALGLTVSELQDTGGGILEFVRKDWETLFWEAGSAIKQKVESGQMSLDLADTYGEMLFGKKYSSLKSLIGLGQEGFADALEEQTVASDEAIKKDAELNDAVIKLQNSFEALKMEVLSGLAPVLTDAVGTIDSLLGKIMEYLQSPEGQEALKNLQEAVSGLFEGLGEIDPESLVKDFSNAFNGLLNGLNWIVENKDTLVTALEVIAGGFAALKLGELGLNVWKLIDGLKELGNFGKNGNPSTDTGGAPTGGGKSGGKLSNFLDSAISGLATQSVLDAANKLFENARKAQEAAQAADDSGLVFFNELARQGMESGYMSEEKMKEIQEFNKTLFENMEPAEVTVEPVAEDDSAAKIAGQVGEVTIPAKISITGFLGFSEYHGAGGGGVNVLMKHANGLPFVPYDGYLAMLHRGERVLTASANRNYTYYSNNYFGNVNLNNGQDIDALCTSIDRHNRQVQSGFGA